MEEEERLRLGGRTFSRKKKYDDENDDQEDVQSIGRCMTGKEL